MAALAQDMGNPQRAEELIRKALASYGADGSSESAEGLAALVHLGAILASEGKLAEAEAADRHAVAGYRMQSRMQPPGANYAAALNNLGNLMIVRGRPKEAEALLREALAMWERIVGPDHPSVTPTLTNLGALLQARHRYGEAEAAMNRATRIDARNLPAHHPRIAIDLKNQAGLLVARKRYGEAEQLLLNASAILEQGRPATDSELGQVLANLGETYRLENRLAESRENFARGMKILNATWGPLDPRLLTWLDKYASVLRAAEQYTEAGKLELQATHIRVLDARCRAG
jgi:Tfp pilus assembly protein PilF